MQLDDVVGGATTDALPVAPSLSQALAAARVPPERSLVDRRVVFISVLAMLIAMVAGGVAQILTRLIWFVTNLAFYGRFSGQYTTPVDNRLGFWVVVVPVLGGIVVGLMARYGSAAIRGHGIPEAMKQVLLNRSRVPARITLLKPLSAAIAIGTGGPFGAEGPIIATGGAFGSLVGQLLRTTAGGGSYLLGGDPAELAIERVFAAYDHRARRAVEPVGDAIHARMERLIADLAQARGRQLGDLTVAELIAPAADL